MIKISHLKFQQYTIMPQILDLCYLKSLYFLNIEFKGYLNFVSSKILIMIKYTKKHLLLTYLLALIAPFTEACDSKIDTMGCHFYVKSNSPDCTTFDFQKCEWQVCDSYSEDLEDDKECIRYKTITQKLWGSCLSHCCKESGEKSYQTLNNCYEQNKSNAILIGSIIGGIIGLILIIVIVICCRETIGDCRESICQCIGNCCSGIADCFRNCCSCFSNAHRDQGSERQSASAASIPQQIQLMEKNFWVDCEQQINNREENCAICLDNITSVCLECNHVFHSQCIQDWISRRAHCPLCNAQIVNMTIYCKKCMSKKMELTLEASRNRFPIFNQYCQSCA